MMEIKAVHSSALLSVKRDCFEAGQKFTEFSKVGWTLQWKRGYSSVISFQWCSHLFQNSCFFPLTLPLSLKVSCRSKTGLFFNVVFLLCLEKSPSYYNCPQMKKKPQTQNQKQNPKPNKPNSWRVLAMEYYVPSTKNKANKTKKISPVCSVFPFKM